MDLARRQKDILGYTQDIECSREQTEEPQEKQIKYCQTPSTDDNHSHSTNKSKSLLFEQNLMNYNKLVVESWRTDLLELFQLVYIEDFQFSDLSEYFTYSVCLVRNLNSFHQILYESIKIYIKRIKSNIYHSVNEVSDYRMIQKVVDIDIIFQKNLYKSFGQHSRKYCQILSLIIKSYEIVEEKSHQIQKIVNFFMIYIASSNNQQIVQQLNCTELHRTLFVEMILKDEAIKSFLDNLNFIQTESKFYQSNFKSSFNKLTQLNMLRQQSVSTNDRSEKSQQKPIRLSYTVSDSKNDQNDFKQKIIKPKKPDLIITHDVSDLFVSPKETIFKPSTHIFQNNNTISNNNISNNKISNNTTQNNTNTVSNNSKINSPVTNNDTSNNTTINNTTTTNTTSQKIIVDSSQNKQKKKKNKKKNKVEGEHKDDIKELERKMELEHEITKKIEKIKVEFPQEWINKLKHKFTQNLKNLH